MSKIQKGDVVRFMNAVGGGKVTRVDDQKGMVYVEDQDGFEVPVLSRECVVVPHVNEKTNFPLKDFSAKTPEVPIQTSSHQTIQINPQPEEIFETPDGDVLKCLLAFIPTDIKNLQSCSYDCLLINDSNYFLFYNIIAGEDKMQKSVVNGIMEPNVQEELITLAKHDLNDWENLRIQIVAFKKGKAYQPQRIIDYAVRIAPIKFYKLHSFSDNEYFDEQAMLINLMEKPMPEIKADDIKRAILEKDIQAHPKQINRPKINLNPDVIEVDLHIHELTDNTSGLNNADMLQMQLDKFHAVIAENIKKKGQKIVFIHGKGEGVLRNEILKLLKTRYKSFYYQDASFREYGFGATMIVIR